MNRLNFKDLFASLVTIAALVLQLALPLFSANSVALAVPGYLMGTVNAQVAGALQLSISGSASANPYVGNHNQQFVSIDWGDGVRGQFPIESDSHFTTNFIDGQGNNDSFTTSWIPISHTYSSAGTKTIFVKVHHQGWNGNGEGDGSEFTAEAIIPPAALHIIKHVVGGTVSASNFTINVTGVSPNPASFPGSEAGTVVSLSAGSYSVDEVAQTGYQKTLSADCSGTIASGQNKTCTITNTFSSQPITHILTYTAGPNGSITGTSPQTVNDGADGTAITAVADFGFHFINWSDASIANPRTDTHITSDISVTANFEANPPPPPATITVTKTVTNDNGGILQVADFPLFVDQTPVSSGQSNDVTFGTHTVHETSTDGYATSAWGGDCATDGTITVANGDHKTCTITNDDIAPSLTLVKQVVGDAPASDWTLTADGPTPISGAGGATSDSTFKAGVYALSESIGPANYLPGAWTCDGGSQDGNSITLGVGASATCTITNTFTPPQPGSITIIKNTIGGDGSFDFSGNLGDFTLTTSGGTANQTFPELQPDTYSVSENTPNGWNLDATCTDGKETMTPDQIVLADGGSVTCTFTNTKQLAQSSDLSTTKSVDNTTPNVGDNVIYTVTVSNAGPDDATSVVVEDLLPSGLTYVSDDGSGAYEHAIGFWTIGDLENEASATLHIIAAVDSGTAGQTIVNTASAESNNDDANTGNNSHDVSLTVNTPPPPPPPLSGGGGGSSSGGGGFIRRPPTPPAPPRILGQVLGASTTCGPYINEYIKLGKKNTPNEVNKLKLFLNIVFGLKLPLNGIYNATAKSAVEQFQLKYWQEVLAPWVPHGLATAHTPTGYVYKTTKREINNLMCATLALPMPQLP